MQLLDLLPTHEQDFCLCFIKGCFDWLREL